MEYPQLMPQAEDLKVKSRTAREQVIHGNKTRESTSTTTLAGYLRIGVTTCPWTSVSRISRPLNG